MVLHSILTGADLHQPRGVTPTPLSLPGGAASAYLIEDETAKPVLSINTSADQLIIGSASAPFSFQAAVGFFDFRFPDNITNAFRFRTSDLAESWLVIDTLNTLPQIIIGNGTPNPRVFFNTTGDILVSSQIGLGERAGDPSAAGNTGYVYTKDISTVTQLFYRASDGTITQLTPSASGSGTGTTNVYWWINTDASAGVNENPNLLLSGGDGGTDLVETSVIQDSANEFTYLVMLRNAAAIVPVWSVGGPVTPDRDAEQRFQGGDGTNRTRCRIISDSSAGLLSIAYEDDNAGGGTWTGIPSILQISRTTSVTLENNELRIGGGNGTDAFRSRFITDHANRAFDLVMEDDVAGNGTFTPGNQTWRIGGLSSTASRDSSIRLHSSSGGGLRWIQIQSAGSGGSNFSMSGDETFIWCPGGIGTFSFEGNQFNVLGVGSSTWTMFGTAPITFNIADNTATSYRVRVSSNDLILLDTTNNSEIAAFGTQSTTGRLTLAEGVGVTLQPDDSFPCTIRGGESIGAGAGGDIIFETAAPSATFVEVVRFGDNRTALFTLADATDSIFVVNDSAGDTYINASSVSGSEATILGNATTGQLRVDNVATGENEFSFNSGTSNTDSRFRIKTGVGATSAGGGTVDLITVAIPSDYAVWFEMDAIARNSAAGTESRRFKLESAAENDSGTAAVLGTAITDAEQGDTLGTGSPDITVVYSGANMIVRATASTSLALNWVAILRWQWVRGT